MLKLKLALTTKIAMLLLISTNTLVQAEQSTDSFLLKVQEVERRLIPPGYDKPNSAESCVINLRISSKSTISLPCSDHIPISIESIVIQQDSHGWLACAAPTKCVPCSECKARLLELRALASSSVFP